MECDNDIYEEVDPVGNVYEVDAKRNSDLKKTTDGISMIKSPAVAKKSKKKPREILTIGILLLLIAGVAAGTIYAVYEIFKLKSEIASSNKAELQQSAMLESSQRNASLEVMMQQQMIRDLEDRIEQLQDSSNFTAELIATLQARLSLEVMMHQQQMRELQGRIQQFQNFSNFTEATLSARIAQLQTYMQDAIQQNSAENRQMNNSIVVLNSIVGHLLTSCSPLPTSFSAAEYGFVSANGAYVHQSCPQETTRCGRRGRWRLLANLDMPNSIHQCYSNLTQHIYSNRRLCVRNSNTAGCSSVVLPTTAYRSVCGMVRAYQFGQPEAFHPSTSIDSPYVEGVSITHGSPRQHIWTFAASTNEQVSHNGCPCIDGGSNNRPPFVGNNYFCDTGTSTGTGSVFYGSNPLWDGAGCGPTNNCCSFNNPPWFYRELLHYTNDYIELRVCSDFNRNDEDIAIERVEIYVN